MNSDRKFPSNEKNDCTVNNCQPTFESHIAVTLKPPKKPYLSPVKEKPSESKVLRILQSSKTEKSPGREQMTHSVLHVPTFEAFSYEKKELESDDSEPMLFNQDAKLYYFNEEQDNWLEKGNGALQIIGQRNRFRVFMRDRISSDVCVAHAITPDMDLKPNAGSDRSWVWFTLEDVSSEPAKPEQLAAEFLSVESSFEFKRVFEECRDSCDELHEGHVRAMAASFNSNSRELPSLDTPVTQQNVEAGTVDPFWYTCTNCHVENNVSNKNCLICGAGLTGIRNRNAQAKFTTKAAHNLLKKEMKKKLPTPRPPKVAPRPAKEVSKENVLTEWWKCLDCAVENNASNSHCSVCLGPKVLGETKGEPSSQSLQVDSNHPFTTPDSAKSFGTSISPPMSFADLASSAAGFRESSNTTNFPGGGSTVFGERLDSVCPDLSSKPIVSLAGKSNIDFGDEKDECVFAQHVKLLRFDSQAGEWKEKGAGVLNILHNIGTQRMRIVMRRDKVLSLCANHYITSEMELKAPEDTDKAWLWTALDYSNDETSVEQLSAVFKTKELAAEFKMAFDNCRESAHDNATRESEPDDPRPTRYYEGFPTCSPEISKMLSEFKKQ